MLHFRQTYVAGALAGVLLAFSVPDLAAAGPMSFPGASSVTPQTSTIVDVRYCHRYPAGPAIAFGLFGALLGSAIADSEYDNDDYYGYGGPYYSGGPGYVGGWNGGHRGGHYSGGNHTHYQGHRR